MRGVGFSGLQYCCTIASKSLRASASTSDEISQSPMNIYNIISVRSLRYIVDNNPNLVRIYPGIYYFHDAAPAPHANRQWQEAEEMAAQTVFETHNIIVSDEGARPLRTRAVSYNNTKL